MTSIADHLNVGFALIHKEVSLSNFLSLVQGLRALKYSDSEVIKISSTFCYFKQYKCQGWTILWPMNPNLFSLFLTITFQSENSRFVIDWMIPLKA